MATVQSAMPNNNPLLVLQIDDERGPEIWLKIPIYFVMFLKIHLLTVIFPPYLQYESSYNCSTMIFGKKYMNHDTQVQILLWHCVIN